MPLTKPEDELSKNLECTKIAKMYVNLANEKCRSYFFNGSSRYIHTNDPFKLRSSECEQASKDAMDYLEKCIAFERTITRIGK